MKSAVLGKGAQELREKLYVEGPDLLWHRSKVAGQVRTPAEVNNNRTECLDKRRARVGEACDARAVSDCLIEGAPEHEPSVLDCVVVIHPCVAFGFDGEVHAGVVG